MKWLNNQWISIGLPIAFVLLYFLPALFWGQDAAYRIHDNLDSNVAIVKTIAEDAPLLSNAPIARFMNGLPRTSLHSDLNVYVWLNYAFSPFTAYLLNQLFIALVAFVGMVLLLSITPAIPFIVQMYIGAAFAILPYDGIAGISVAGLPLLAWALWHFYANNWNWRHILVVVFSPFYMQLAWIGVVLIPLLGLAWVVLAIQHKKLLGALFFAVGIFSILLVATEYRLVYEMLITKPYISHRSAMALHLAGSASFMDALLSAARLFVLGKDAHAISGHILILLIWVASALIKPPVPLLRKLSLILVLTIAGVCLFTSLYEWQGLRAILEHFALFKLVHFSRLYWFVPVLWYIVLAFSLVNMMQALAGSRWRIVPIVLMYLQIFFLYTYSLTWKETLKKLTNKGKPAPTWRQFYAEDLFKQIEQTIAQPKNTYRVGSIGLYPGIAQYNGFYTIDGYVNNYPLSYKKQFREAIAPELERICAGKPCYFDYYGSRCYLFVYGVDLPYEWVHERITSIPDLRIQATALKKLHCNYIFSSLKIENAHTCGLELKGIFSNSAAWWKVYLYAVQ